MTRDELLDPDKIPTTGTLRMVDRTTTSRFPHPLMCRDNGARELVLQRYNADRGEWVDVPILTQEELDGRGVD